MAVYEVVDFQNNVLWDKFYSYVLDRGNGVWRPIAVTDTREEAVSELRKFLVRRYGEFDEWEFCNEFQFVHPKSPGARTWGSLIDGFVRRGPEDGMT